MLDLILEYMEGGTFLFNVMMAIFAVATVLSFGMPLLDRSDLQARMRAVAIEREKIRSKNRDLLNGKDGKGSLRNEARPFVKEIVDKFKLENYFGFEDLKDKLRTAGLRSEAAFTTFLFLRLILPISVFLITLFYLFVLIPLDQPAILKIAIAAFAMYFGYQLPRIYLTNRTQKRQLSISRALPDALDLLLICVEAGMAMEPALKKVCDEIGKTSIPLAEELSLTLAELSYLQDRRMAFENLGNRTGLEAIKSIALALIQTEKYGTGLSQTLRVLAQENRDQRMIEAEKKAAGLPPKLTVPMILFFLPALFIIILGPAAIRVMETLG
jgi:tight adherence protein C